MKKKNEKIRPEIILFYVLIILLLLSAMAFMYHTGHLAGYLKGHLTTKDRYSAATNDLIDVNFEVISKYSECRATLQALKSFQDDPKTK